VSLPEPQPPLFFSFAPPFFPPSFFPPQALNEWDVVSLPEPYTLTVHEGRVAPSGRQQKKKSPKQQAPPPKKKLQECRFKSMCVVE
jgi:hypothetical protein